MASDYIDPAAEPIWDNDPNTEPGYSWACNACPFGTLGYQQMLDHLIEWRDKGMTHMGYERPGGSREEPARRRMAIYHGGLIQTQRIPRRAPRAGATRK